MRDAPPESLFAWVEEHPLPIPFSIGDFGVSISPLSALRSPRLRHLASHPIWTPGLVNPGYASATDGFATTEGLRGVVTFA